MLNRHLSGTLTFMYSLILLNRAVGWLVVSFFGRFLGTRGVLSLILVLGLCSFLIACLALVDVGFLSNSIICQY
jgi:hypothetical protein